MGGYLLPPSDTERFGFGRDEGDSLAFTPPQLLQDRATLPLAAQLTDIEPGAQSGQTDPRTGYLRMDVADSGTANTQFSVTHNLGYVPSSAILAKSSVSGSLYDGTTAWTATTIYLRFSGANSALTLWIF